MSSHRAERPARGLRRGPLAVLCVAAALASVTSVGTYAFWNDTATVAGATVTSGTLDLKVNNVDNIPDPVGATTGLWTPLVLANMAPGESKAASLTLRNNGTVPMTVTATGSATGDLASSMVVRIVVGGSGPVVTSATYPRVETCALGAGAEVHNAALTGSQVVTAARNVSPAVSGGTTDVCVQATLPSGVQNTAQGKTWQPTFVFTATQR